jgi:UDP-N-acetylmuramoyl-tripeptide--D-alanyl-D-alanine ligase
MLELGDYAPAAHQAIGRLATQLGIDEVLAVGQFAEFVAQGASESRLAPIATYQSVSQLLTELPAKLHRGDGVLIKGSRRLNLEQVTEFLVQHYRRS